MFDLHFFRPVFRLWMSEDQFPQRVYSVPCYIHQFFLNKSADHAFLLVWIPVIKYTHLERIFNKVLDNIFYRIFPVIKFQVRFAVHFAKEQTLHADIRLYNKWILKTVGMNPRSYFIETIRRIYENCFRVKFTWQQFIHFLLAFSF